MSKENTIKQISCSEAGRIGGEMTLARYGIEFFRQIGKKGQAILTKRYSSEQRRFWGQQGGRPQKVPINLGEED